MKILIENYTFNAATGQVTFSDYGTIEIERVLLITNVVDNVIIYNFADPARGGTVASNVLTLTFDTSTMDDNDALQIFYDDPDYELPVIIESLPLPADAATATNQTTEIGHLSDIDTGVGDLASTVLLYGGNPAQRVAIVNASGGQITTFPISAAALPLPSGASTLAEQETQTAHLADIVTAVESLAGTVSGAELQVDIVTIPTVTVQATNLDIRDLTSGSDSVAAVQSGSWTVTANAGTNLNTSLLAVESGGNLTAIAASASVLDDWDETDRAKVNIIAGQAGITAGAGSVAANTPRVTMASDSPDVTALQLIDNIIIVDDAAFTPATTSVAMIGAFADETGTDSVDEGDAGALRMTLNRRLLLASHSADDAAMETGTKPSLIGAIADETSPDLVDEGDMGYVRMDLSRNLRVTEASLRGPGVPTIDSFTADDLNFSAGNNQVVVSSAPNKQIWVYGIGFTLSAQGTVSFQDEDDAAITGVMPFAQYSGLGLPPSGNFGMPMWKLATDKDLELDLVTADLDGWISYAIVSV